MVATPIGNLKDITLRALEILNEVSIILCEDTRRTKNLLNYYNIKGKKFISYFEGNETKRIKQVLELLNKGIDLALVSDAGTPLISDPGYKLVKACRDEGIEVIPIPGPSALISALSVSGIETDKFIFLGFLPRIKGKRVRELEKYKDFEGSIVIFVSVHKINDILNEIYEIFGNRKVFVAREMTKIHEEYIYGNISDILDKIKQKGEFVVIISKSYI